MEQIIKNNIMPDEYKNKKVNILCNDCEKISNVNFHFIAMKCSNCCSYNTKQLGFKLKSIIYNMLYYFIAFSYTTLRRQGSLQPPQPTNKCRGGARGFKIA